MSHLHNGQLIFIVTQIDHLDLVKQVNFVLTLVSTVVGDELFLCAWFDDVVFEADLRRANRYTGLIVKSWSYRNLYLRSSAGTDKIQRRAAIGLK